MQLETRVKTTDAMTANNLLDRVEGVQTRLAPERRIMFAVGGRAAAIGDQNRRLNNVLGQLERT